MKLNTKRSLTEARPRPRSGQSVNQNRKRQKAPRQIHVDLYVESEGEILAHLMALSGPSRDEAIKVSPLAPRKTVRSRRLRDNRPIIGVHEPPPIAPRRFPMAVEVSPVGVPEGSSVRAWAVGLSVGELRRESVGPNRGQQMMVGRSSI
jgi:hypothetical protein